MRKKPALVLVLALTACGPTKFTMIGECEMQADRLGPDKTVDDAQRFIVHCMQAKGYSWSPWVDKPLGQTCAKDVDPSVEPECYHQTEIWGHILDR